MMIGIVPGWHDRHVQDLHFATDLPLTGAPGAGLIENRHAQFQLYLDRIYAPTAAFILLSSLGVLIIFHDFIKPI